MLYPFLGAWDGAKMALDGRGQDGWYHAVTEECRDLIVVMARRPDGRFGLRWVSGSVKQMMGIDAEQFRAMDDSEFVHPEDLEYTRAIIQTCAAGPPGTKSPMKFRCLHADGTWRQFETMIVNRLDDPEVGGLVFTSTDVTERRLYDPLTGLPNRTLLLDRVGQLLGRRRRGLRNRFALLVLGLDRYRETLDAHGHASADLLVETTARRIVEALRPSDTVARLESDMIAVLLTDPGGREQLSVIWNRIRRSAEQPVSLEDSDAFTPISTGIAADSDDFEAAEDVLQAAVAAMHRSRIAGSSAEVFDVTMLDDAKDAVKLEVELAGAIERDELELHYQPIVRLSSGAIAGYEALVRWRRHGELVPPSKFVPVAERSDLINDLGTWVLRRACAETARRADAGTISVNLSARQLSDRDLPERVAEVLEQTRLRPSRLELELTETALSRQPELAAECLRRLRELGVNVARDDFGTGHASLHPLLQYSFDTLKIDRSFVTGLSEGGESAAIVPAVIGMAKSLQLTVIAEGIETRDQLARLQGLRCGLGQGFHFAKPAPAKQAFTMRAPAGWSVEHPMVTPGG